MATAENKTTQKKKTTKKAATRRKAATKTAASKTRATGTKAKAKSASSARAKGAKNPAGGQAYAVLEQLVGSTAARDWVRFADKQSNRIFKEVTDLTDDVRKKVGSAALLAHGDEILAQVKDQLKEVVDTLDTGLLFDRAMNAAKETKAQLLGFFNIPSQKQVKQLQRKLSVIEARLASLQNEEVSAAAQDTTYEQ